MEVTHPSSCVSALRQGTTLFSSQHRCGSRSYRRGPNSSSCESTVWSPTRSTTFSSSISVSFCLNASVSAKWNPVSRNRIGTPGRMPTAMWMTAVPSAWNDEAMPTRGSPESRRAQRKMSVGWLVSKRAFSSRTIGSERRVCN